MKQIRRKKEIYGEMHSHPHLSHLTAMTALRKSLKHGRGAALICCERAKHGRGAEDNQNARMKGVKMAPSLGVLSTGAECHCMVFGGDWTPAGLFVIEMFVAGTVRCAEC